MEGARDGSCRESKHIDVGTHLFELFLDADAEFLLFVDDEQSQVFEFQFAVGYCMSADEDVYFAAFEVADNLVAFLGGAKTVEIVDVDRHALEAFAEGVVVLESQNGAGNEDCHLFAVAHRFEGGADGHLSFAEAHVAANQTVHGCVRLHIAFDVDGGFQLVGSVLVHEAGFKLVLQVAVGTEGEATCSLAFGIEFDEILGDVLNLPFGFLFQHLPRVAAQSVEDWRLALLAHIAADFVKAVNADV